MENENSTVYLNYLRVFAALAVLVLHVICTPVAYYQNLYSSTELFWVRFARNLMNWCVPVFVMITGVLFLNPDKELPLSKLFKKYISRFVLVILIFGTLYCFMELLFSDRNITLGKILLAVKNTLTGKSWDHMWYIYMVIGLYLLLPPMKIFINNVSDKLLYFTLGILFLFSSIIPYLQQFMDLNLQFPCVSIYLFYLLFGYVIHYKNFCLKNVYAVIILISYCVYISLIQFNSFFLIENNAFLRTLGYESPIVAVAAFAIFSLCKNIKKESRIINFVAPLTFGVYIMHPVFINFCYKVFHITVENYPLIISLVIVSLITIIGSLLATWILRLIPFVRKRIL